MKSRTENFLMGVNPARAGMILAGKDAATRIPRKPRASGDDPALNALKAPVAA